MPDAPDFYRYRLESNREPIADIGELAGRIGSICTYDRRGSVMFADSFEDGLSPYTIFAGAPNATCTIDTDYSFRGGQSAKLYTAAGAGNNVTVRKYIPHYSQNKVGYELHLWPHQNLEQFYINIYEQTETHLYRYAVRLDWQLDTIGYLTSAGAITTAASYKLHPTETGQWFVMKLVADLENQEYVRFMLDNYELGLSGLAGHAIVQAQAPAIYADCTAVKDAINVLNSFLDDIIVTVDEP